MEDLLKFLISPLLADPTAFQISQTDSSFIVTVPESDMGKVIGKHGQSIFHLRTLLHTYCKLNHLAPKYLQIKDVH